MAVKRTTFQEKCDIMLSIFRQKRDFFNAKEIEKLSIKKGVLQQAVKEVLQSLIDDNFVIQEKLGTSNYYWSFVNDEGQDAVDMKEKLLKEQKKLIADIEALRKNITSESKGREPSDERTGFINEYNSNNEQLQKIEIELKAFAECDPRVFLKRKEEIKSTKEEINKATEDIFVIRDYICNKFGMDRKDFNTNFGISDEMDVID